MLAPYDCLSVRGRYPEGFLGVVGRPDSPVGLKNMHQDFVPRDRYNKWHVE
jgi:hypothetical protein